MQRSFANVFGAMVNPCTAKNSEALFGSKNAFPGCVRCGSGNICFLQITRSNRGYLEKKAEKFRKQLLKNIRN
jgi:hypothetical protein